MVRSFKIAVLAFVATCALSCSEDTQNVLPGEEGNPLSRPETPQEAAYVEPQAEGALLRWNYQSSLLYFSKGNLESSVVDNPRKLGANKTRRCLSVKESDKKYGVASSDYITKKYSKTFPSLF